MFRSPIFFLLFVFTVFSCQKSATTNADSLELSDNSGDSLIVHYAEKAANFQVENQYDSAFYYFSKSKDLAEVHKDSSYRAYNLLAMARIQQTFADYAGSEETLTEALPLLEENSDYYLAALNLFGIGAKQIKNYDAALNYYRQIEVVSKDSISTSAVANNIAIVYMDENRYKEAISKLKPYLKPTFLDTLPQRKARIIDNLGLAYFKNKEIKEGLQLMEQALKLRIETGDSYGSIMSYLHLAEYYQMIDVAKAQQNALKAYDLATQHHSVDERLEALEFLMMHNSRVGQNKFAVQYANLNDSITTIRNQAKNQFAKIKYDSQKATVEALKYKGEKTEIALKLQSKQLQNYLMAFGLLLLIMLIIYLIHYFKAKNTRDRLQTSYNTETRIAKKLHDELANDVFYTMTFAETQDLENNGKKERLLDYLDKIYHKTRNISRENSPIDTGEAFFMNLKESLSSYESPTIKVIIRNGNPIEWSKLASDKKIALQRVIQELMVNMKKHSGASLVVIGFDSNLKQVIITYSDNGIGFSETAILKNGLQNAENRIQAVKGLLTFDFNSPKGFKAQITFPN